MTTSISPLPSATSSDMASAPPSASASSSKLSLDVPARLPDFKVPAADLALCDDGETEKEEEETRQGVLEFMHVLEGLKTQKRAGWVRQGVEKGKAESISDHMYRMAMLSMLLPEKDMDIAKCVQLALVHDLAEASVGDITPEDGVTREEKQRREEAAIQHYVNDLLRRSPAALRIERLWNEYEEGKTKEAKVVKDLDRFELCLQAVEYERRHGIDDLQPFFRGSSPYVRHPRIRNWTTAILAEREALWTERGWDYGQDLGANGRQGWLTPSPTASPAEGTELKQGEAMDEAKATGTGTKAAEL